MPAAKFSKADQQPLLADATVMIWHKTTIRMYGVSDSQLEELTGGYNSLYLVFFGICVGAAVTLWVAMKQSPPAGTDRLYYFVAFLVSIGFAVVSGLAGLSKLAAAQRCKKKLYEEASPIERV
jgi:hypothetical protein